MLVDRWLPRDLCKDRTVIDIDLIGSFNASRAAFAQLRRTRGCLIYLPAGMACKPPAFQAHVGAAKAGIDMLMKNLAIEWGRHGVRANSIVPGPIEGTEGMPHPSGARRGSRPGPAQPVTLRAMARLRARAFWPSVKRLNWVFTTPSVKAVRLE
ncbi:MAG: SDR family oxidoreductase [Burkholderiales bacterium]|nr:SDR family oxidoreductase [Burkholderiales bacterium]MDE1927587.1 SDR family oxidoreductase [Burkholderiales bacterium]MDE2158616.1 SDR family oxidoreductase [Burkholderiales bacterium]MDE2505182.1 SDR family oxidoreductase [Burkholderiales bacterium]